MDRPVPGATTATAWLDPATLNKGDTLQLMFCSPTDGWWEKTVQISVKMSKCKLI